MILYIYDENGSRLLRTEEGIPECGEDFCDRCGDCLACYGGHECIDGHAEHFWVQYGEKEVGEKE